jgi:hypothetical protein
MSGGEHAADGEGPDMTTVDRRHGRVRYTMKKPRRDGTLSLVLEPEDLLETQIESSYDGTAVVHVSNHEGR